MPVDALRPISTPRLALLPVTPERLGELWRVMREPDLRDYQDIPRVPIERFAERLTRRSARLERGATGRFEWLLATREAPETSIGWVSIRFLDRRGHRGELGYSVLTPWRRRGYVSEAIAALVDAVFSADVADAVEAYCMPENLGSRGVLRRAGLIERERLRHGAVVGGEPVDVLRFDLPRHVWSAARDAQGARP